MNILNDLTVKKLEYIEREEDRGRANIAAYLLAEIEENKNKNMILLTEDVIKDLQGYVAAPVQQIDSLYYLGYVDGKAEVAREILEIGGRNNNNEEKV